MSRKKSDMFTEITVGAFVLGVLALLAYFTIVISGVDVLMGHERKIVKVSFDAVGGLKEHDAVMYRGMKVGAVEHISLTPSNILVEAKVDRSVVLRPGYRISVANMSMLGGYYLKMDEGAGEPLEASCTFVGERPTDWMHDVADIARNVNAFTSGGDLKTIVTNFEAMSERLRLITERVERGEGMLGKLLSTNDTIYADLAATVANVKSISTRLENGEGALGQLLSTNETVSIDLKRTLANAREVSDRLARGEGLAGRLLAKDDPLVAEVDASVAAFRRACESVDAREVLARAEKLLGDLGSVTEKMKSGEGTLGKLVSDDKLYREVDGLARDLRQVLDNYRDTTPIATFSSLIMGGL